METPQLPVKKRFLLIFIITLVIIIVTCNVFVVTKMNRYRAQLELADLKNKKESILRTDSIKTVIEQRVQDSLNTVKIRFQKEINLLHDENSKLNKQNIANRIIYDNINIDRPDY